MSEREQRIRQRAYEIWQEEGYPDGRHDEHWQRAAREIDAREGAGGPAAGVGSIGTGGAASGGQASGSLKHSGS